MSPCPLCGGGVTVVALVFSFVPELAPCSWSHLSCPIMAAPSPPKRRDQVPGAHPSPSCLSLEHGLPPAMIMVMLQSSSQCLPST